MTRPYPDSHISGIIINPETMDTFRIAVRGWFGTGKLPSRDGKPSFSVEWKNGERGNFPFSQKFNANCVALEFQYNDSTDWTDAYIPVGYLGTIKKDGAMYSLHPGKMLPLPGFPDQSGDIEFS